MIRIHCVHILLHASSIFHGVVCFINHFRYSEMYLASLPLHAAGVRACRQPDGDNRRPEALSGSAEIRILLQTRAWTVCFTVCGVMRNTACHLGVWVLNGLMVFFVFSATCRISVVRERGTCRGLIG